MPALTPRLPVGCQPIHTTLLLQHYHYVDPTFTAILTGNLPALVMISVRQSTEQYAGSVDHHTNSWALLIQRVPRSIEAA